VVPGRPARLKIDIKDATGSTPAYPVLVHLNVGGPGHGTLTLDPDGALITCTSASFLWHEMNAQGQVTSPNEEFEYKMGTFAPYAGAIPDPQNPGALKPVWAVGEALGIEADAFDENGVEQGYLNDVGVHVEPGVPDHFEGNLPSSSGSGDTIELWDDYNLWVLSNPPPGAHWGTSVTFVNAYKLVDRYGNATVGYANASASSSAGNVTPTLTDQTGGVANDSDVNLNAYQLDIAWNDAPSLPQGNIPITLRVDYPADPEWGAGSISKSVTLQFDSGTYHFLLPWQDYDAGNGQTSVHVLEGAFPLQVGPGASGDALPKSSAGDNPRLTFLTITGSKMRTDSFLFNFSCVDYCLFNEPFPNGHTVYLWDLTTQSWDANLLQGLDPALEIGDSPAFRLTLQDGSGKTLTDGVFQANLCPRYDHNQPDPPDQPGRNCSITPTGSVNGVIQSVTVNPNGAGADDSRGYLAVELLQAPSQIGDIYVKVESLDQRYRIRDGVTETNIGGAFPDFSPGGWYVGAFRLATVANSDLLDENFKPVNLTLNMSIDRVVYAREVDRQEAADSYQVDFILHDEDTSQETTLQNITMRRLGRTSTFMTDAISIVSPDEALAPLGTPPGTSLQRISPMMALKSIAGTVSPAPGRYTVKDRRNRGGTIVYHPLRPAVTRLAEITAATPNFDGVTPGGPLDGPFPSRDHIEANVKWGANGYISTKLVNVDSDKIFTFDFWHGQRLTTDLESGALPLGPPQSGNKGDQATFGPNGSFKALVAPAETVKPGLYLLRAQWGQSASDASSSVGDPICVTDQRQAAVCDNEWVVSVGQRILLTLETDSSGSAAADLANKYFPAVYVPPLVAPSVDSFIQQIVADATKLYTDVGANVILTTDDQMLKRYLTHRIKSSFPIPDDCAKGQAEDIHYGCTNNDAAFPLLDPNLDLANSARTGIDLDSVYRGPARGYLPDGTVGWVDHLPVQARNQSPSSWSSTNLSPDVIFLNRLINTVAHESAHGFGLVSGEQYGLHGSPAGIATMESVDGKFAFSINGLVWLETPAPLGSLHHEPWNLSGSVGLMSAAPFRWRGLEPQVATTYDDPDASGNVSKWLLLDHPLRFSMSSDFVFLGPDQSVEQFFRERLPLCTQGLRSCR
jgi:hypothetical protein